MRVSLREKNLLYEPKDYIVSQVISNFRLNGFFSGRLAFTISTRLTMISSSLTSLRYSRKRPQNHGAGGTGPKMEKHVFDRDQKHVFVSRKKHVSATNVSNYTHPYNHTRQTFTDTLGFKQKPMVQIIYQRDKKSFFLYLFLSGLRCNPFAPLANTLRMPSSPSSKVMTFSEFPPPPSSFITGRTRQYTCMFPFNSTNVTFGASLLTCDTIKKIHWKQFEHPGNFPKNFGNCQTVSCRRESRKSKSTAN